LGEGNPAGGVVLAGLRREQLVALAAAIVAAVVVVALLLRISSFLKRRGSRGRGVVLAAIYLLVPLAFVDVALGLLGLTQGVINSEEVATGAAPVVGTLAPARVLHFVVIVLAIHLALWLVDLAVFTERREKDLGVRVPKILRDTGRWLLLLLIAFLVAGWVFEFDVGRLSILAGALSIALSLALGPTLGSLISGITLISERPFELGDWIDVEGSMGRVDQITWRSTRIITRDHHSVVFPNSMLASVKIVNLSRPEPRIRIRVEVGVHYRTPPLRARETLEEAVRGCPEVLDTPAPWARIKKYGDSSIDWEVLFWIEGAERLERIRAAASERIWYALDRAGIEIPFPIRNVIMRKEEWESARVAPEEAERRRRARNLALLRAVPVLGMLPPDALDRLAAAARDEVYLDGERIIVEGIPGDRMYVVAEGGAKVRIGRTGAQEVKLVGPGDFFGERSLLTGAPRAATFVAAGTVRLASLGAEDLQPILRERPEFAEQMATLAAERKHRLEELADRAAASPTGDAPAEDRSTLVDEIARFFHLPRRGRGEGGGRP